jgi:hypothetical protein
MTSSPPKKTLGPKEIFLLCLWIIPTLALAFWLTLGNIWPVSIFIDWQTKLSGGYYPKLTVLITWACMIIPVLLVRILIKGGIDKAKFGNSAEEGADGSTTITIQRSSQLFSRFVSVGVFVDGKQIGVIGGGKTKTFSVNPGTRTVHAAMGKYKSDAVTVSLSPGNAQQLQMGFTNDVNGLNPPVNALYLK